MNSPLAKLALVIVAITAIAPSPATSRTWYVNISGTGDAPTIAAALDSAVAGDSVLVGPGHYETETCYHVGEGVVLASEMGPAQTRITGIGAAGPPPCVVGLQTNSEVRGFWLETATASTVSTALNCRILNNVIDGRPGNALNLHYSCTVENNLFLGSGQGIYVSAVGASADLLRNIVLCEIECQIDPPFAFCNDFAGPDTQCLQAIMTVYYPGSNFTDDPQFCGIDGSGDYYLQADSPCAPGNTPLLGDCGLIGPLPVACGPLKTEVRSWGAVKSMYRE